MTSTINIRPPKVPEVRPRTLALLAAGAVLLVVVFGFLSKAFVSVDANEIGVKIVRGQVEGTLAPGWHLISPIGGKVKKFSTRIQQTSMLKSATEGDRTGDDAIDVASKEGARMSVDMTINYRLRKTDAVKLFGAIRDEADLRERVVRPGVRSVTRDIFARYPAREAITTARSEIQAQIEQALNAKFSANGINIETIDVRGILLPANIQAQVDQAITAEAAAQKATIERKQKETEAETSRLVAEKGAQQKRIEAQGNADAKKISSEAEADANRKIAESLSANLIELRRIEAIYKQGNQIYFVPSDGKTNVFVSPPAPGSTAPAAQPSAQAQAAQSGAGG